LIATKTRIQIQVKSIYYIIMVTAAWTAALTAARSDEV